MSKSTDKLALANQLIQNILDKLPSTKVSELKAIRVDWKSVEGGCHGEELLPCPVIEIKF